MITTLVEEEVTDDEDDMRAAAAQAKAQRQQADRLKAAQAVQSAGDEKEADKATADAKAKGVKTAPKGKPQPANQKGMMSFFGKK